MTGSRGQGVTGGVGRQDRAALDRVAWHPTQDRAAHTAEGRLQQQWEEEDRVGGGGDVGGAERGSSREGGCANAMQGREEGERMSSASARPEHGRGNSGNGTSKPGCSPLSGTPASEEGPSPASSPGTASPSRAFLGARPATPWEANRGLQRFASHPHLPGLLAD